MLFPGASNGCCNQNYFGWHCCEERRQLQPERLQYLFTAVLGCFTDVAPLLEMNRLALNHLLGKVLCTRRACAYSYLVVAEDIYVYIYIYAYLQVRAFVRPTINKDVNSCLESKHFLCILLMFPRPARHFIKVRLSLFFGGSSS